MQIKRILVPVDSSELSARAMHASVNLAGQLGAVIVSYVAPVSSSCEWSRIGRRSAEAAEDDFDEVSVGSARLVLAQFEAVACAAGVTFESVLDEVRRIDKAILVTATRHRCDLIVMVALGRGAFGEFLFGSQTKAILADSRLPLLVLH